MIWQNSTRRFPDLAGLTEALERDVALRNTCDTELNKRDIYGDGDQSFIRDEGKRNQLRNAVRSYLDVSEKIKAKEVSGFWMACFTGQFELVAQFIHGWKELNTSTTYELLERCETQMRFTPLMGAVTFGTQQITETAAEDYLKTVRLLIQAGANVNARDIVGCSVLTHCLNVMGSAPRAIKQAVAKTALELGSHDLPGRERAVRIAFPKSQQCLPIQD